MTRVICNHQKFSIAVEQIKAWLFSLLSLSYLCFKNQEKNTTEEFFCVLEDERGGTVFVCVIFYTVGEIS